MVVAVGEQGRCDGRCDAVAVVAVEGAAVHEG